MKTIKPQYGKFLVWMAFSCLGVLFMADSLAQTADISINSEQTTEKTSLRSEIATPKTTTNHAEANSEKNGCASPAFQQLSAGNAFESAMHTTYNPYQQLGDLVEKVTDKSVDNSDTISNLSAQVYIITAFILALTLVVIAIPLIGVIQLGKLKSYILNSLRTEFIIGFMDESKEIVNKEVNKQIKNSHKRIDDASAKHEDRLYHAEKVRSDFLVQSKPKEATMENLFEWVIKQQENYVKLLMLISPKLQETTEALVFFRDKHDKLPDSFFFFFRFLAQQGRLPGDSGDIAVKIVQEKFGKSLEKLED